MVRAIESARAFGVGAKTAINPPTERLCTILLVTRSRQILLIELAPQPLQRLLAEIEGKIGTIPAASDQNGVEARIDHLERQGVLQLCIVPAGPPRVFRRPFRLSHAAMAGSSSMA